MERHRSAVSDAALPTIFPPSSDVRAHAFTWGHTHIHTHARGHGHTVAASGLPTLPMLPSRHELQEERRRRRGHISHVGSPTKLTAVSPSTITSRTKGQTPPSTGRARDTTLPPVTLAIQFLATDDEPARRQALLEQTEHMWRERTRKCVRASPQRWPHSTEPVPAVPSASHANVEPLSLPASSVSQDHAVSGNAPVEPRTRAPVCVAAETQTEDADHLLQGNLMDAQVGTEWDLPVDDHSDAGLMADGSSTRTSSMAGMRAHTDDDGEVQHSVSDAPVQPEAATPSWDIEDGSSGWNEAAEDEGANATTPKPAESGTAPIPDDGSTDEKPPSTEITPEHDVEMRATALALAEGSSLIHGATQESPELTHDIVERVGSSLFSPTSSMLDAFVDDEHIIASPNGVKHAQQTDSRQMYDVVASVSQEPTYISSQTDDRVSAQSSIGVLRTPSALSMKPRRERDASQTGLLARMRNVAVDDAVSSRHRRRLSLLHMTEPQQSSSRARPVAQRAINDISQASDGTLADNSPDKASEELAAEPVATSRQHLPHGHVSGNDSVVRGGNVALSALAAPEDRHEAEDTSPGAFSEHVNGLHGESPPREARDAPHEDEPNAARIVAVSTGPEAAEGVQHPPLSIAYSAPPSATMRLSAPVDDIQLESDDARGHAAASAPEQASTSAAFVLPTLSADILEPSAGSNCHHEPRTGRNAVEVPGMHTATHASPSSDVTMLLPSPDTHAAAMSLVSGARDLVQRMRERGAMPSATQTPDDHSVTRRMTSPLRPTTAPASTTRTTTPASLASRSLASPPSAAKAAPRPATTRSPVRPAGIRSPEKAALLSEAAGLLARMGRDVRGAASPMPSGSVAQTETTPPEVDAAAHKRPSVLVDDDLDTSHDSEDIDAFHLTLRRLGMSYGSSAIPELISPITDLPDAPSRFPAPLSS